VKKLAFILVLAAVAAAGWWGYRTWRGRLPGIHGGGPAAPLTSENVPCQVWFPSREGMELCEETSSRPKTDNPAARLRGVIDALHCGPTTPCSLPLFPGESAPRAVFLAADGTAYLDYPAAVFERSQGLREETLFIRALARTILRNCPDVRAFVILGDGSPRDLVSSHMSARGKFVLPTASTKK